MTLCDHKKPVLTPVEETTTRLLVRSRIRLLAKPIDSPGRKRSRGEVIRKSRIDDHSYVADWGHPTEAVQTRQQAHRGTLVVREGLGGRRELRASDPDFQVG
jgi:hypothetical protein